MTRDAPAGRSPLNVAAPVTAVTVPAPVRSNFEVVRQHARPADCGKKIEATQLSRGGSLIGNVIKRDGSLLAVMVPW